MAVTWPDVRFRRVPSRVPIPAVPLTRSSKSNTVLLP
jgi:hypothetical protein